MEAAIGIRIRQEIGKYGGMIMVWSKSHTKDEEKMTQEEAQGKMKEIEEEIERIVSQEEEKGSEGGVMMRKIMERWKYGNWIVDQETHGIKQKDREPPEHTWIWEEETGRIMEATKEKVREKVSHWVGEVERARRESGKVFELYMGEKVPDRVKEMIMKMWTGCIGDEYNAGIKKQKTPKCCRWCGGGSRRELRVQHVLGCTGLKAVEKRKVWRRKTEEKLRRIGIGREWEKWKEEEASFWEGVEGGRQYGREAMEILEKMGIWGWRAQEGTGEQEEREVAIRMWKKELYAEIQKQGRRLIKIRQDMMKEKGQNEGKQRGSMNKRKRLVETVCRQIVLERRQTVMAIWAEYLKEKEVQDRTGEWLGKKEGKVWIEDKEGEEKMERIEMLRNRVKEWEKGEEELEGEAREK